MQSRAVVSQLLKPIQVELYNDKWLDSKQVKIEECVPTIKKLDDLAFKPHSVSTILTLSELLKENNILKDAQPSNIETVTTAICVSMNVIILESNDKILYTITGT